MEVFLLEVELETESLHAEPRVTRKDMDLDVFVLDLFHNLRSFWPQICVSIELDRLNEGKNTMQAC